MGITAGMLLSMMPWNPLQATDCSLVTEGIRVSQAASFNITYSGFSSVEIATAIGYWDDCQGYGSLMPNLRIGGSDGIPVTIQRIDGPSQAPSGSCGAISRTLQDGRIVSAGIRVWTQQANGSSCAPLTDTIAHELGHVYGLANADDASCTGHIMGSRAPGGTRTVYADDCEVARDRWLTPSEPSGTPGVTPNSPANTSPLVINLDRQGFRFTDAAGGVEFDLDADGFAEQTAWLGPGSRDGFLVLDRDGDGEITSGAELFGDRTVQPPSAEPHGFQALAVFDDEAKGGNRNGSIDPGDGIYPFLAVWIDESHDGLSQAGELHSLENLGVRSIGLAYVEARRRDHYGNLLRYKSQAQVRRRTVEVVDVYLLREDTLSR